MRRPWSASNSCVRRISQNFRGFDARGSKSTVCHCPLISRPHSADVVKFTAALRPSA